MIRRKTEMMKRTLRIALTPFMLIARLMLGLAAFISSIASAVIGLAVGLFAVLSVVEFTIGYWQNGIAFMVLALLASPIGLPAIANFLLNRFAEVINDALLATIIPNGVQTLQPLKISALKEFVLASMGILWYT